MPQDINVPVVTPNPIQFQPPTDLINGYLNRQQQNQQDTLNRVTDLGTTLNAYKQQRIQNQLAALAAHVNAVRQIGPDMTNQIYGGGVQSPGQPNTSVAAPAGGVGGGSGNDGGTYPQSYASDGSPSQPYSSVQTAYPQSSANPGQTAPAPSSQGSPQTLGGNQQPAKQSDAIDLSLAQGHTDHTDYQSRLNDLQNKMVAYGNQGEYGKEQAGQLAAQVPIITAQMNNQRESDQFTKNQQREKDQFAKTQGLEVGKASASESNDASTANTSVLSGLDAIKQLDDAYQKVPANQKGPGMGSLIAHAGNLASQKYPDAVAFNKLREGLIGPIAAGIDPKGRQGPSLLDQLGKTVPGVDTDPKVYKSLMSSVTKQLLSVGQRNSQSYNSAAQSFGGSTPQPTFPINKFEYKYTATNPTTNHQIVSNDQKKWFDAQTGKPVVQ